MNNIRYLRPDLKIMTPMTEPNTVCELRVNGLVKPEYEQILTPDALAFVADLHRKFDARRKEILGERARKQLGLDAGRFPMLLPETIAIRTGDWVVAPTPPDLLDRRVEITGPVSRKMVINALNAGAKVFMADFEDSNAPSWKNNLDGQVNLRDAIRGDIAYTHPKTQKLYTLNEKVATLMVRPRGWHLVESGLEVDGAPVSGSLFDFGLYFFHNAMALIEKGSGPYFYLPKLECHQEARLWNDVFVFAQERLGIPQGTIKATVLVETLPASFELHEILYELREHSAGLNCGRWDYIFSYIKRFRNHADFVLPDRDKVTMEVGFMEAYSKLVIQTCHKRGVHAMGGMAAQIPIKGDDVANELALGRVRADKLREATNGHDGTWVAHPGLVAVAMEIFDEQMPAANQWDKGLDLNITAADLITAPKGAVTEAGVRKNINVGILYIESWLQGNGAAAIYHLMEDAATAEISRAQIWQWIHHKVALDDGRCVTYDMCKAFMPEEMAEIKRYVGQDRFDSGQFDLALQLFDDLISSPVLEEFLTINAYQYL